LAELEDLNENLSAIREDLGELLKTNAKLVGLVEKLVEEAEKKPHYSWEEEDLFTTYEIRDTKDHFSKVSNIADYDVVSFFVNNELDQPCKIRVLMNWRETTLQGVPLGEEYSVGSGEQQAWTINAMIGAWLPFMFIKAKCDIAPTKGALHVKILKRILKVE